MSLSRWRVKVTKKLSIGLIVSLILAVGGLALAQDAALPETGCDDGHGH